MSKCRCSWCINDHRDFVRGAVDESDFAPDFRYVRLKRKKSRKFCSKEKGDVPCKDTRRVVEWSYTDREGNTRATYSDQCVKCHKKIRRYYRL